MYGGYDDDDIDIDIDGKDSNGDVVGGLGYSTYADSTPPHRSYDSSQPLKQIDYLQWWCAGHELYNDQRLRGESPRMCDVLGNLLVEMLSEQHN